MKNRKTSQMAGGNSSNGSAGASACISWAKARNQGLLGLCLVFLPGCVHGSYVGTVLNPPATKIVVFEIEGDTAEEFTHGLAIQLSGDVQVVHGHDLLAEGDEVDESDLPALCRQVGAQAFVVGELTLDKNVDVPEWVIRGFFELHDVENDVHIGGVPDAEGTWNVDPLYPIVRVVIIPLQLVRGIFDEKGKDTLWTKYDRQTRQKAEATSPKFRQELAKHVAKELSKGLGVRDPQTQE